MKIFIGADHRGFAIKAQLIQMLREGKNEVDDLGAFEEGVACDYPLIAALVAKAVAATPGSCGILVCLSGIGHAIAANKVKGAYAALCYNTEAAVLSREHNNSNILVLGAQFVPPSELAQIVQVWLKTDFAGGRHERRFKQIQDIEKESFR